MSDACVFSGKGDQCKHYSIAEGQLETQAVHGRLNGIEIRVIEDGIDDRL